MVLACILAMALPLRAHAAAFAVGEPLPTLTLNDQHDKPLSIGPETRWLLFTSEKAVGDMVSSVLSAEPVGVLDRLHLVYVADISAMPAVVTRMFALPKLRALSFSIALVRDPMQIAQLSELPRQPGSATLLRLEERRVVQVITVGSAGELRAALGLANEPAPQR
jgi:hypothetical protein